MDPEQQRHLERILALWAHYRFLIVAGVLLAGLAVAGYSVSTTRFAEARREAAEALFALRNAVEDGDFEKAAQLRDSLADIDADAFWYHRDIGAFLLGKASLDDGDAAAAADWYLQIVDESRDQGFRELAALRRAEALIAEGKPKEAQELLEEFWPENEEWQLLFLEASADADAAGGNRAAAQSNYIQAIEVASQIAPAYRFILQAKLGALMLMDAPEDSGGG